MNDDDRLSGALQENVLTLLCFSPLYCQVIRLAVKPQLFESAVFREVAGIAIDFIDQFREPVADHLADQLEGILEGEDQRKASVYRKLLDNMFAAKDTINGEYVKGQLQRFVRLQNFKSGIAQAVELADDGKIDEAENVMTKSMSSSIVSFDGGTNLGDASQATAFLDSDDKPLLTGIECLDHFGVGPARKTLFTVMAPLNRGKSWWLMHLGKWALIQRHSVLHITLEMSEQKTAARYLQAFFSITKHQGQIRVPTLTRNHGEVVDVDYDSLTRPSYADPNIRSLLNSRIAREFRRRPKMKIKEFPTGQLTIPALNAYLDNLERFEKWTPDVVIIDSANLMKLDAKNLRQEMGANTIALRGIGVERNIAMVTASQTNREGINARVIDENHMSEDVSGGFTSDTVCTYNQTPTEHAMGLARIFVSKHRDDAARMMALITQSYAMGQFCLDSSPLMPEYWNMIGGAPNQEPPDQGGRRRR
jgi:replicative DNA helicase